MGQQSAGCKRDHGCFSSHSWEKQDVKDWMKTRIASINLLSPPKGWTLAALIVLIIESFRLEKAIKIIESKSTLKMSEFAGECDLGDVLPDFSPQGHFLSTWAYTALNVTFSWCWLTADSVSSPFLLECSPLNNTEGLVYYICNPHWFPVTWKWVNFFQPSLAGKIKILLP